MTVLYVIIGLIVLAVVFLQLFLAVEGKEKVTVHTGAAWELESKAQDRLVLKKKLVVPSCPMSSMTALMHAARQSWREHPARMITSRRC